MEQREEKKINWRSVAWKGLLLSKTLTLIFGCSIACAWTIRHVPAPYGGLLVGLEIALTLMVLFTGIKRNTFRWIRPYDFKGLQEQKEPVEWLLTNITYDIGRYEEGASYFYNGVRLYKYTTVVLAGISTIALGLDFNNNNSLLIFPGITYTLFAKNLALVIGAIITVSTTLMTYWNIEKYWMFNKTIVNKLRALKEDVEKDYLLGWLVKEQNGQRILQEEKFTERLNEYKSIKGDFYKYWEGALADRGAAPAQGSGAGK